MFLAPSAACPWPASSEPGSQPLAEPFETFEPPASVPLAPLTPRFDVHDIAHPQRPAVECFIADIYARRYGASVRSFAPILVSLRGPEGIVAAAGYRAAESGPLFLERYLPRPVEALLPGSVGGAAPARSGIIEVGHLASSHAGEGRRLIRLLGPHLAAEGCSWVVSTLTAELRNLFVRLGITPLALGVADPAVLGDEASHWGTYYDHRPLVLAGQLRLALHHLARRAATEHAT